MNLKKSFNVALAMKGLEKKDFASELGISRSRLYAIMNQKRIEPKSLENISKTLGMTVSEFIALGE